MSTIIHEPRYTIEQAEYGWDIIDSQTGESIGVFSTKEDAAKSAQARNALHTGNAKRLASASFKADLNALDNFAGAERLAALFDNPPDVLLAMQLIPALTAVKGIGRIKAGDILRAADVRANSRRVRDLSERQRIVVARALRTWGLCWDSRRAS